MRGGGGVLARPQAGRANGRAVSALDGTNISEAFDRITEHRSPCIAAAANGQGGAPRQARGRRRPDVDEGPFVMRDGFTMRIRDRDVEMGEGDLIVVPAGVKHMPVAGAECWIMRIETADRLNTGEAATDRTRRDPPRL